MKRNDYLLYIAFIIIGLLLSYNTNFLNVQEVKAESVKTELPTIKFNPNEIPVSFPAKQSQWNL